MSYFFLIFTVDSQAIDLGSDDTSNDFSCADDDQTYEPSLLSSNQEVREINKMVNELDLPTFNEHVKRLEAKRLENANETQRMTISDDGNPTNNTIVENVNDIDEGWGRSVIERQIRLQEEDNAHTSGRLTAPPNETRLRRTKSNTPTKSQTFDALRSK